jgi:hypothetical protein
MSKAAREVVDASFLDKYGNKLGHILPETEQVIKELAMPEEIRVLGKKIKCEISEEDLEYARLRMEIIKKRPHFCLTRQINMLYDCRLPV